MITALLAGPACEPPYQARSVVVDKLEKDYREQLTGIGTQHSGVIVELYVGDETWTILLTRRDGCSTGIAFGDKWWSAEPVKGVPS